MKKLTAFISALVLALTLLGCSGEHAEQETAAATTGAPVRQAGSYAFSGENEYLRITGGSIVIGDRNETIQGGVLEILQPDLFANMQSYSTTFYTLRGNGERNDFHSTNVTGARDGAASINPDLGSMSSNGYTVVNLEQGLWFELIATDVTGKEQIYLLELTVEAQS